MNRTCLLFLKIIILMIALLLPGYYQVMAESQPGSTKQINYDEQYFTKLESRIQSEVKNVLQEAKSQEKRLEGGEQYQNYMRFIKIITQCLSLLEQHNEIGVYANKGIEVAKRVGDHAYQSLFLSMYAVSLMPEQEYSQISRKLNEALLLAKLANNQKAEADVLLVKGQLYYDIGDYELSLESYLEADKIFDSIKDDSNKGLILGEIAIVYSELGQLETAISYQKKVLALQKENNDLMSLSIGHYNISTSYMDLKDYEKAKAHIHKAYDLSKKIGDTVGIGYALKEIAMLKSKEGNYESAILSLNSALLIFEENNLPIMKVLSYLTRAKYRAKVKDLDAPEDLKFAKTLVDKIGSKHRLADYYESAAYVYFELGQFESASEMYQQLLKINKKYFDEKSKSSLKKLQVSFDFKQKEIENQLLLKNMELRKTKLEQADYRQYIMLLIIMLVGFALILVVFFLHKQLKSKELYRHLAMYDELTQAPNRRHILSFAKAKLVENKALKQSFTIAILDIDLFKAINDTYGHDVGDRVLQQFSNLVATILRGGDRFGRIGGEEWLLVLSATTKKQAKVVFKRLQRALEGMTVEGLPSENRITVSMGGIELSKKYRSIDAAIKKADEALYQAKDSGRNKAIVF